MSQRIQFKTEAHEGATAIFPVFSDQSASDMSVMMKRPDIREKLGTLIEGKVFSAEASETLEMHSDHLILLGMGVRTSFHPDILAAQMRKLAAKLAKSSGIIYEVYFTQEMIDAVQSFDRLSSLSAGSGELSSDEKTQKGASTRKGKRSQAAGETADESEKPARPDYFSPASIEELISQSVSSLIIGSDSMDILKSSRKTKKAVDMRIIARPLERNSVKNAIRRGELTGLAVNESRYMASLPGNYMHPELFETYAKNLIKGSTVKIKVLQRAQLLKMGMNGVLSVGKGSAIPPRVLILEYKPVKPKFTGLVLVGKGITFDTGGISLKPAASMHEMKYDMCGAALVLHTISLAAKRKLPVQMTALIGLAENMPSSTALKPGDVYTAYNGKTVEVQNTDAEGRLVLADLLSYASDNLSPSMMLDFATLTGAAVIGLGHEAAAVMTADERLAMRIDRASRVSLDRSWRLPHWQAYDEGLKSDVADLRNIGGKPAGTITAMRFLSNFVDPEIPWAHVDIAGTAWRGGDRASQSKGATGWGVRMMNQFLEDLIAR